MRVVGPRGWIRGDNVAVAGGGCRPWGGRSAAERAGVVVAAGCLVVAAPIADLSPASGAATTLYVGASSCSDSGPGTDAGSPFCTISAALGFAAPGTTVRVAAG